MARYTLRETHAQSALPGKSYDVLNSHAFVVASILMPGIGGNNRYGLYLPEFGQNGRLYMRIYGEYPGQWYDTAEEALAAYMELETSTHA